MKIKPSITWAFILLSAAMLTITPLSSAEKSGDKTTGAEVKQETEEMLQALKSYSIEQRDEAVRKTSSALTRLDHQIDALESQIDSNWEKMDQAARKNARASLKELRHQRTQVAEWYGSLKTSSVEAWGHMKEGFSKSYKSLQQAWEKSEKEFGPDK